MEKLATKAELKAEQDKIVKRQTHDSILFVSQSYFIDDGSQNFLTFQLFFVSFAMSTGHTEKITAWKSKELK